MGLPPKHVRRIDLLGEEKDVPIPPSEVDQYPTLGKRGSPYPVAMVEVAVKRLSQTPMELIKEWRQGQKMVQPQPEAPKETKPRKSATMHVRIELGHDGFPSDEELLVRHRLEDLVLRNRIGKIVDAGAGGGVMDLLVRLSKADGRERFQKLVSEEGLSAFKVAIE
jgi:hypothetical protein